MRRVLLRLLLVAAVLAGMVIIVARIYVDPWDALLGAVMVIGGLAGLVAR